MKAKLIRESISDLLIPKKEEDIKNVLEKFSKSFYEMYQHIKKKYGLKNMASIGFLYHDGYEIVFSTRQYDFEVMITKQKTIYIRSAGHGSIRWEEWIQVNDVEDLEKYIQKTIELDESLFKPKDLNTVFQDKVYNLEQTNEYLHDVYKLVNSNIAAFRPLSLSEFINDTVILKIITKAFYGGQNPNKPANEIKKYLLDKGHYLGKNVVVEGNIFRPKSAEEIRKNIEKTYPIDNAEDATNHLGAAIYLQSLPYVQHALNHGAKILNNDKSGLLWQAFNETTSDEILIELLKHPTIIEKYNSNDEFKESVISKAIYMGNYGVVDWLLKNLEHEYSEVLDALSDATDISGLAKFKGYDEATSIVLKWLEEHKPPQKPMRESVGDVLEPRSNDEISKLMKTLSYEDYEAYIVDEIAPFNDFNKITNDRHNLKKYKKIIERGYEEKLLPKNVVMEIVSLYNKLHESVGDVLKPKSEEEITKSMENMDVFGYRSILIDLTFNSRFYSAEKYVQEVLNHLPNIKEAFNKKISPLKFFNSILEEYYNNYWEPDGFMQLTNTGGIEIKLIDSEYVEYRFTGEIIPKIAEIEYGSRDEDEELENNDPDLIDYFEDEQGNKWFLSDFMKI